MRLPSLSGAASAATSAATSASSASASLTHMQGGQATSSSTATAGTSHSSAASVLDSNDLLYIKVAPRPALPSCVIVESTSYIAVNAITTVIIVTMCYRRTSLPQPQVAVNSVKSECKQLRIDISSIALSQVTRRRPSFCSSTLDLLRPATCFVGAHAPGVQARAPVD